MILAASCIAGSFALADRLAGGWYCKAVANWIQWLILKWPDRLQKPIMAVARMRSVAWATLWLAAILAAEAAAFHLGYDLVLYAVGFAAWRWDGWTATGAGIDPGTLREVELYAGRQAFAYAFWPIFLLQDVAFGRGIDLVAAGALLALFAMAAAGLGWILERATRRGLDINTAIELMRGLLLGAAIASCRLW